MESKQSSYSEPASARWWDRRVGGERPGQSWTPPSPMMLGCRLKHKYIFLVYIGFTYTFDISWKWKGIVTEIESDMIRYPLFSIWRYHSDIFCSTPYHICECRILKYSPLINLIHILAKIVVTFKTFRLVRKMDKRSESVNQNSWVWSENVDIRLIWIHYYDQMLPRICNNTSTWHQE